MSMQLGISGADALGVAVSTFLLYVCFVTLVRLGGPRSVAGATVFDIACIGACGAVIGRATLMDTPTPAAAIVALVTLFLSAWVLRQLDPFLRAVLVRRAQVLVRDGSIDHLQLRRSHLTRRDLNQALRLAGIAQYSEVRRAVLERNGQISVLRRDAETALVDDVEETSLDTRVSVDQIGHVRQRSLGKGHERI